MALGFPEDYLCKLCDKGPHISKVNYYPKIKKPLDDEPRVLEHTDHTIFTILTHMDPTPKALQAQKRDTKEWVFADPVPKATFVNIGDFMEMWTNKFVSTVHRVDWPKEGEALISERISNAFFVVPNYDAKFCQLGQSDGIAADKVFTYMDYLANHKQRIKSSGY